MRIILMIWVCVVERDGMWLSSHVREMLAELEKEEGENGKNRGNGWLVVDEKVGGDVKTGVSSRELSGEMGGDTVLLKVV